MRVLPYLLIIRPLFADSLHSKVPSKTLQSPQPPLPSLSPVPAQVLSTQALEAASIFAVTSKWPMPSVSPALLDFVDICSWIAFGLHWLLEHLTVMFLLDGLIFPFSLLGQAQQSVGSGHWDFFFFFCLFPNSW